MVSKYLKPSGQLIPSVCSQGILGCDKLSQTRWITMSCHKSTYNARVTRYHPLITPTTLRFCLGLQWLTWFLTLVSYFLSYVRPRATYFLSFLCPFHSFSGA